MASKSQTVQLSERLGNIRAKAGELRKQLEGLEQQERRLALALEVLAEEFGGMPSPEAPERQGGSEISQGDQGRATMERTILDRVFTQRDGLTSGEVVKLLAPVMEAKYGTVVTTLSRMVAKGLLRKEGKKAFRTQKGRKP